MAEDRWEGGRGVGGWIGGWGWWMMAGRAAAIFKNFLFVYKYMLAASMYLYTGQGNQSYLIGCLPLGAGGCNGSTSAA